jgi:hypothetical protein
LLDRFDQQIDHLINVLCRHDARVRQENMVATPAVDSTAHGIDHQAIMAKPMSKHFLDFELPRMMLLLTTMLITIKAQHNDQAANSYLENAARVASGDLDEQGPWS